MKSIPQSTLDTVHTLLPEFSRDAVDESLRALLSYPDIYWMALHLHQAKHFMTDAERARAVAVYLAQLIRKRYDLTPLLNHVPNFAGVPTGRQKSCFRQRIETDCITPIPVGDRTLYLIPSRVGKEMFECIGRSPCRQENILAAVKLSRTRISQVLQMMERMGWISVRLECGVKIYSAIVSPSSLHLINRKGHGFDNLIKEVVEALEGQQHCVVGDFTRSTNAKRKVVERILDQLIGASLIHKSGNHYSLLHQDTPIYAKAS